jgi:ABC-2 type transport system permease protein
MNTTQTEKATAQVQEEKLAAAVFVPADFTTHAMKGEGIPLKVTVLPGSPAGTTARNTIQAAANHLLSAVIIAQISAEAFETQQPFTDPESRQAYIQQALRLANQAWAQPSFTIQSGSNTESASSAEVANKGYLQSSPGMLVMFAILDMTTCSMVLFLERKNKTLERLCTTPIHRAEIIGGHLLAVFAVVFLQEMLLVCLGQLFFGVDYLREPPGILLMMRALALWVASLGLLIGAISKAAEHVILWSLVAMFLFSPLGGAWFPLEITGETFSKIGHLTPVAWAMDGFQNIVLRGLGTATTLLPAAILLAFAGAFFMLAVWRFKFE